MNTQVYKVRDPSGTIREIRGPAGASDADVIAQAQRLFAPPKDYKALSKPEQIDPTEGTGFGQQMLEGAGKAFVDIGRGVSQLFGGGPSDAEMADIRELEKPLMSGAAGNIGNIGANVAMAIPTAAIPGANTVTGAGLVGGVMGLMQPTGEGESRLANAATGTVLGAGGQKVAQTVLPALERRAASEATRKAQNVGRDANLREFQDAGYVTPPSAVNDSFLAKRLESVAGKAAIGQEAAIQNQSVTNSLARKALGMGDDTPLSESALNGYRAEQGKVYGEVSKLSKNAGIYLEKLKDARNEAKTYWNHANRTADPNSLRNARHFDNQVAQFEALLEKEATKAGKADLIPALKQARSNIAKSYDIEKALNEATGDIDARIIGRLFDQKGSKAVTGELATIGKFANQFSPYAREGNKVPTPGVSKLEALAALGFGLGGTAAAGPVGALLAAAPLASGPVRSALLSKLGQKTLAQPKYGYKNPLAGISQERLNLLARIVGPSALAGSD